MPGRLWLLFLCGLSAFAAGSLYSWSALSGPLAEFLSQKAVDVVLTGSDLSAAFALASALTPLTMLVSGFLSDRTCPKNVILAGACVMGFGLYQCARAEALNDVIVYYGLFFGLGLGLAYGSLINYAVKLYPDKKGFAGGFVTSGYSLGSVVLPPVLTALYLSIGIDGVFRFLGVATALIIGASTCFFKSIATKIKPVPAIAQSSATDLNWRQMLGKRQFYVAYGFVFGASVPAFILLSHAGYLSGGIGSEDAYVLAWLTSVFGVANAVGRMSAGIVSDYLGRKKILLISLFIETIGLALLVFFANGMLLLGIVFGLIGYAFGAAMGVMPAWVSDQFGIRHSGLNYGILITGVSIAGILGPMGFLGLEKMTGSQDSALAVFLVVLGVLAVLISADRKIR